MSNTLDRALRLSPSVDLESCLGLGVGWSWPSASASGIGDEGIQNELAIAEEAAPDARREDVEVRLESIDGRRVGVDSLGRTLSLLNAVDVDKRLVRPGMIEPNLMPGADVSLLVDGRRSCWRLVVFVIARGRTSGAEGANQP